MSLARRLTLAAAASLFLAPAIAFAADDHVDASLHAGSVNAELSTHADKVDTDVTPYPGARRIEKDEDGDGSLMLSLMSGAKGLKLSLAKYTTKDAPEKVIAFYKTELAKRGAVTVCDAKNAKSEACSGDGVHSSDDDKSVELRVGTKDNQRVVAVTPKDKGTELVLLRLELPGSTK
ncbi:MAG: hypothetical protein JST54_30615 [Deltaproteobacteria bacterium]|nr:hypothetical protein [Deltaproteobacteria bacterium]